jgi:hypothetical protein
MNNFQDELRVLVDKWLEDGDATDDMISDLESEITRLKKGKGGEEEEDA